MEMEEVEEQIKGVNGEIKGVNEEIKAVEDQIKTEQNTEERTSLREKERQLREKERQLREKERQLRENLLEKERQLRENLLEKERQKTPTTAKVWVHMQREYTYINVKDGDIVYEVLERVLHQRELTAVMKQLQELPPGSTKEETTLRERQRQLQLESQAPGGRVGTYSDLEVLNGSTLIDLDQQMPSGVGMSMKQALHVVQKIGPPQAKRPRTLHSNATPPYCSSAPSDLAQRELKNAEAVPAYYHWMALLLQDKFGDVLEPQFTLDGVDINVPPTALDNAVDQLMALSSYSCENEHELSSLLTRTMDRFLFCDDDIKLGAALSQFPLQNTRRADLVVVKLEDWVPSRPVIATNDSELKSESFDVAVRETQCYTICALTNSPYRFPYSFGLPYCKTRMALEMHISVHQKLQHIHIAETDFCGRECVKKFLSLTYGAIHWLLRDEERKSDRPMGPRPTKDLELFDRYSNRVFLKDRRIYKFYETDGTRKPNVDTLKLGELDYMQPVEYRKLSDKFELVSYPYLEGIHEPQNYEQFINIGNILCRLHQRGLVHGDIRCVNLIFGSPHESNKSYIIDFDYTSKSGDLYPSNYNGDLAERHPEAKANQPKYFKHDWHSLSYICKYYYPRDYMTLFKGTVLDKHL